MAHSGSTPFVIEALSLGQWEVRSPHAAIQQSRIPETFASLMTTKKRDLRYLMESADWDALPVAERILAEDIFNAIDEYAERIDLESRQLHARFARLQAKIRRAVETGEITPRNGGIKALTSGD